MEIKNGEIYRIKGNSPYFKGKYGIANPEIKIEGTDLEVFGKSWTAMDGNPACMFYGMRSGMEDLPINIVYYGKINGLGELVHEWELETIN